MKPLSIPAIVNRALCAVIDQTDVGRGGGQFHHRQSGAAFPLGRVLIKALGCQT
jgi:hypothetical protein